MFNRNPSLTQEMDLEPALSPPCRTQRAQIVFYTKLSARQQGEGEGESSKSAVSVLPSDLL